MGILNAILHAQAVSPSSPGALTVSFISFGLLYLSSDPAIAMAGEQHLTLTLRLSDSYTDLTVQF